jgi:flagellar biosynthetic protein FliR
MLLLAFQAAGSFIDLQIGLGSAQILNPMTQQAVTLFAQFKYWLALVLLLMMNGHHMMIQGLVSSYDLAAASHQ